MTALSPLGLTLTKDTLWGALEVGEPPDGGRPRESHPAAGRFHRQPQRGRRRLQGEAAPRVHGVAAVAKARRGRKPHRRPRDPSPGGGPPRALAGRRTPKVAYARSADANRSPSRPASRTAWTSTRTRAGSAGPGTSATAGSDRSATGNVRAHGAGGDRPGRRTVPSGRYSQHGHHHQPTRARPPHRRASVQRARRRHQAADPRRGRAGGAARRCRPPDPRGRGHPGRPVQGWRALPLPLPRRTGGGHGGPHHRAVRRGHRRVPPDDRIARRGSSRRLRPGLRPRHHGAGHRRARNAWVPPSWPPRPPSPSCWYPSRRRPPAGRPV